MGTPLLLFTLGTLSSSLFADRVILHSIPEYGGFGGTSGMQCCVDNPQAVPQKVTIAAHTNSSCAGNAVCPAGTTNTIVSNQILNKDESYCWVVSGGAYPKRYEITVRVNGGYLIGSCVTQITVINYSNSRSVTQMNGGRPF